MMCNDLNIGNIIKKIRKEKGYSQRKLGELSGVSHTQIAIYETGKSIPTLETLEKIFNSLGYSVIQMISDYFKNLNKESEVV